MKVRSALALVSACVVAALLVGSEATNSTWGYVRHQDLLLLRQNVVEPSRWLSVASRNVVFPAPGSRNYHVISAIRAVDRARKNGGLATLYGGGPGSRNATIHLKSLRGQGLNFTVEIYGY